jgi:peptidoglycan/xylan/chitin deacetylase (PgdA/CDA1 family)
MIAKNEEQFLANCLNSVKDLVDEIILVDTGSSDKTIEIAKSFGAKVFFQEWEDDFSKPRNLSLRKATGDWILVLDSDERIAYKDISLIKNLLSNKKNVAYSMPTRNYSFAKKPFLTFFDSNDNYVDMNEEMPFYWISNKIRVFPNNEKIEFRGPVHEIVEESIKEQGINLENIDVPVHHYAQLDEKRSRSKRFFYMNITRKKVLKNPTNAKAYLELGREYFNLRLYHRAVQTFKKGLKLAKEKWLLHELCVQTGNAYEKMKKSELAEKYFSKAKKTKKNSSEIENQGIPIISYHDIGDNESDWCLPFKEFEKQILFLKKEGYEFVTLENIDYNKKQIVLTFDDGRLSSYEIVMPFLKKQDIPATFFITTDWIEGKNIPKQESYSDFMNWKQVKELSEKGHLIGSHTISHKDLIFLNEEEIKQELEVSKNTLEKKLIMKINIFSYPFGHYNEKVIELTKNAGYKKAVTEDKTFCKEDGLLMPRIYVLKNNSFESFKELF